MNKEGTQRGLLDFYSGADVFETRRDDLVKRAWIISSLSPFLIGLFCTLGALGTALAWPKALCVFLFAAALLIFIFYLRYMRTIGRGLCRQEQLLQNILQNDFSERFPEDGSACPLSPELGEALNRLMEQSSELKVAGKSRNVMQTAVLDSLNEGIILTDLDGALRFETGIVSELLRSENRNPSPPKRRGGRGREPEPGARSDYADTGERDEAEYLYLRGVNARQVWQLMQKAIREAEPQTEVLEFAGENELRYIEVYAAVLETDEEGPSALAVMRDVTHMTQLEAMRRDFVANVTHELKTPLTSIRGYIDLLRSRRRSPEQAELFYDILDIEADRLESLIADLLELSEIEEGDRQRLRNETVYLYSVGDEVFTEVEPLASSQKVKLHLDVDPEFAFAANRHRIKQLVVNLVSNAVKYNKEGGSVWLDGRRERGQIRIIVRDNGIGIPQEHQGRIFERFYRVSKSRSRDLGGTGLGLAIVKHIAGLYGGSVQVASKEGEGTVFTVLLPDLK